MSDSILKMKKQRLNTMGTYVSDCSHFGASGLLSFNLRPGMLHLTVTILDLFYFHGNLRKKMNRLEHCTRV